MAVSRGLSKGLVWPAALLLGIAGCLPGYFTCARGIGDFFTPLPFYSLFLVFAEGLISRSFWGSALLGLLFVFGLSWLIRQGFRRKLDLNRNWMLFLGAANFWWISGFILLSGSSRGGLEYLWAAFLAVFPPLLLIGIARRQKKSSSPFLGAAGVLVLWVWLTWGAFPLVDFWI